MPWLPQKPVHNSIGTASKKAVNIFIFHIFFLTWFPELLCSSLLLQ